MAGKKDPKLPLADYTTPFVLYRTDVNAGLLSPYNDPAPSSVGTFPETIDLSNSISALENNCIVLIFKRTAGAVGSFNASLYCTITDQSSVLNGTTVLVAQEPATVEDKMITFRKLYSGVYKVVLNNVPGARYDIYEAHSGYAKIGF